MWLQESRVFFRNTTEPLVVPRESADEPEQSKNQQILSAPGTLRGPNQINSGFSPKYGRWQFNGRPLIALHNTGADVTELYLDFLHFEWLEQGSLIAALLLMFLLMDKIMGFD